MFLPGKSYNYIGSAKGDIFYKEIKKDLQKLLLAQKTLQAIKESVREGEEGDFLKQFKLIKNFFDYLEKKDTKAEKRFFYFFIFKFLYELGFLPAPENIDKDPVCVNDFNSILHCNVCDMHKLDLKNNALQSLKRKIRVFLSFNIDFSLAN